MTKKAPDTEIHLNRLYKRYSKMIDQELLVIPHVWSFEFNRRIPPYDVAISKISLKTSNIVFACMIFEAVMLTEGKQINITRAEILGVEEEFDRLDFNN